jgi:isoleucyl-tRNA synthetase
MSQESVFSAKEKEILQYWQDNKIFEKTLKKPSPKGEYVFYDGPPFATGTPHYGHIVASVLKDIVPRYQTMRGYHVDRRWGWDCHGLPIENIIEKKLGFKTKKEIVEYGINKFNEECRSTVLEYVDEWKKVVPRLGRWADMENPYKTMDPEYMESIWWVFKQLWDKDLIYEGYKSMHVCPRCETTLSQQEVSEGYKDVKDLSVTVKLELVDEPGTYLLAWTTTPWTLLGNTAAGVNEQIKYSVVLLEDKKYIVATELIEKVFADKEYKIEKDIDAKEIIGKSYNPPFDYYKTSAYGSDEKIWKVYQADYVTTDQGTGVVHFAPAFGEEDMDLANEHGFPMIHHIGLDGRFTSELGEFAGKSVKPIEDHMATDVEIIKDLAARKLLFAKEKIEHSYPHCWRCDTPLLNYATSSWFVSVTKVKDQALKEAEKINWSPRHIKEGRFGKWLEGARDWSISRQRFWASVMPVWKCEAGCGHVQVIGNIKELEGLSGQKVTDLHKHFIDPITFACEKCQGTMKRIPDVLDTWFDSGSMPYAQLHYPFANQDKLENNLPAQFIAEGVDQTRAWFYYLHILGTALFNKPAFENVIVNGIVLAEDGKKMSKRLKNYPDPSEILDKYGADALRYYLLTSPVIEAETLNFSEAGVKEALQKNVMLIGNVLNFYQTYKVDNLPDKIKSNNVLDKWILARLQQLITEVTENMDRYHLTKAIRPIGGFINELSTWYLRRSRDRLKDGDKSAAQTLGFVLREFSKILAPALPFTAEQLYQGVGGKLESVHLESWPEADQDLVDGKAVEEMSLVLKLVEQGLSARALAGVKVRQPLSSYTTNVATELKSELIDLVCDELNIKELRFGTEPFLETVLSEELILEGKVREIIRHINQLRKDNGLTIKDRVVIEQQGLDDLFGKFSEEIKKATLADKIINQQPEIPHQIEGGTIGIKQVN